LAAALLFAPGDQGSSVVFTPNVVSILTLSIRAAEARVKGYTLSVLPSNTVANGLVAALRCAIRSFPFEFKDNLKGVLFNHTMVIKINC
jgi:hypothetical protein